MSDPLNFTIKPITARDISRLYIEVSMWGLDKQAQEKYLFDRLLKSGADAELILDFVRERFPQSLDYFEKIALLI